MAGKANTPGKPFIGEAIGKSMARDVRATDSALAGRRCARSSETDSGQEELSGERGPPARITEWTEARRICETLASSLMKFLTTIQSGFHSRTQ